MDDVRALKATEFSSSWLMIWLPPAIFSLVSLWFLQINYLIFHTFAELFSIVIAFTAMIVATTSRSFTKNNHIIFIAILFGWCAGLDLLHTIAYRGMNIWVQDNGNTGIQLWIVARSLQAIGLVIAPLFLARMIRVSAAHLAFAAFSVVGVGWVLSGQFPVMYATDEGLTPIKIGTEIVIIALLAAALLWHRKNGHLISSTTLRFLSMSIVATIFSELLFTQYVYVDDYINVAGHVLKIFAYWFIYLALVHQTLSQPFSMLTRAASTYDAIPDPTLVVDRSGRILQANRAAARHVSRQPGDLVGLLSHSLFHPEAFSVKDCPVCQKMRLADYQSVSVSLMPPVVETPTGVVIAPLDLTLTEPTFVQTIRNLGDTYLREKAERLSEKSQARFRDIFEFSPAPMQIYSISTNQFVAVNRAFTQWLGYELVDIPSGDEWFNKAYPDHKVRAAVKSHWSDSVERALQTDDTVQSGELVVRAKNGSLHACQGFMTVSGEEAIVTWNDLTDIKEKEQALVESEGQFRSMIESSPAGIYVRRAGRFVYVNPRYCAMLGYTPDELTGLGIHEIAKTDEATLKVIHDAWAMLEAGAPSVTYTAPVKHKNGEFRIFELHAKMIDWDGSPAHIVLADDITLREQQREQIQTYVRQLEGSMQSTLEAVAQMVEMRDPYTAGHERRVGLIARDIAKEMGWPAERAEQLTLIGLVHDIGKISVPAEILTKPTRLSDIELQLVRGHAKAGYEILKGIPFTTPVAEIVYQHHERMDGSGYPRGLKGDQILPESRILAVADVVESIGSHRPYRAARGMQVALDELRRGRGTAYDAGVVDALLQMVDQQGYDLPTVGGLQ